MAELNGQLPFGKENYHNEQYEQLLQKVVPLRGQFRNTTDANARREMAKEELDAWNGYVNFRKQQIKDEVPEF